MINIFIMKLLTLFFYASSWLAMINLCPTMIVQQSWRRKWQPLQCSCLENPRDEGAYWAAVYGVTQSRTRLKWLSSMIVQHRFLWIPLLFIAYFPVLLIRVCVCVCVYIWNIFISDVCFYLQLLGVSDKETMESTLSLL